MDEEIAVFTICKYMGWTFQEYESQPLWLIQVASVYLNEENKAKEKNGR